MCGQFQDQYLSKPKIKYTAETIPTASPLALVLNTAPREEMDLAECGPRIQQLLTFSNVLFPNITVEANNNRVILRYPGLTYQTYMARINIGVFYALRRFRMLNALSEEDMPILRIPFNPKTDKKPTEEPAETSSSSAS